MPQAEQVKPVEIIFKQQNMRNGSNKWLQTKTEGQIMDFYLLYWLIFKSPTVNMKNETYSRWDVYTQLSTITQTEFNTEIRIGISDITVDK